jgi:hypothetical protein
MSDLTAIIIAVCAVLIVAGGGLALLARRSRRLHISLDVDRDDQRESRAPRAHGENGSPPDPRPGKGQD